MIEGGWFASRGDACLPRRSGPPGGRASSEAIRTSVCGRRAACVVTGRAGDTTELATPIEEPGRLKDEVRTRYGVSGCRFDAFGSWGETCREAAVRPALRTVPHIGLENDTTAFTIRQAAIALDLADLEPELRSRSLRRAIQNVSCVRPVATGGGYLPNGP